MDDKSKDRFSFASIPDIYIRQDRKERNLFLHGLNASKERCYSIGKCCLLVNLVVNASVHNHHFLYFYNNIHYSCKASELFSHNVNIYIKSLRLKEFFTSLQD